jgi:predicted transcriptional regulator
MQEEKINVPRMLKMVDKGMSQAAIARHFGVGRGAVHKRLKELRPPTSFAVAGTMIRETVERKLDVMDQLCNINEKTYEILEAVQDDPVTALRAVGEIRAQLKLQADLFSMLFDMNSAGQFQEAILETLNEVDPEMRKLAIRKLNEKNSMRNVIKYK